MDIPILLAVFAIVSYCYCTAVSLIRNNREKEKKHNSKRSSYRQTMSGKGKKKSSNPPNGPQTERKLSGCNWEMYKNSLCISPAPATNSSKENNSPVKKKSNNNSHKKKLNVSVANRIAHMCIGEDGVHDENKKKLTKQVALDCEMVGIGDGTKSMIARVSLVNRHGFCVYDKYVKPQEPVKDYRTTVSGIRPHHLESGEDFNIVQQEVAAILKKRILVGHALKYDLDVLHLSHPFKCLRDTSTFKIFRQISRGNTPSLKKLSRELLGRDIQTGEHSSIEDARAAMQLYVVYRNRWESEFHSKR